MTCGTAKIRRLSTASSVTMAPHYILTTDWIWYWKDEYGVWNEYGKEVSNMGSCCAEASHLVTLFEHCNLVQIDELEI